MSKPPELPPEVWKVIIASCRTPLPKAGKEGVTWHELQQHDLTTLMRTSSMLNELTSPILYTEIVVDHIAALYVGIDLPYTPRQAETQCIEPTTDQSTSPATIGKDTAAAELSALAFSAKRLHKRDLLGMVRTMHLVHSPADQEPYCYIDTSPRVSSPKKTWKEVLQAIYSGLDVDRYLGNAATISRAGYNYGELFPHLQRRTSLAWTPHEWDVGSNSYHTYKQGSRYWIEMVQRCDRRLAARIPIPKAPYVCGLLRDGPLASAWLGVGEQDDGSLLPPTSHTLVNAVHDVQFGDWPTTWLQGHIVLGTENHLYLDRSRNYSDTQTLLKVRGFFTEIDRWGVKESHEVDWPDIDEDTLKRTKVIVLIPRPNEDDLRGWTLPKPPTHRRQEYPWPLEVAWADTIGPCRACGRQ